MKESTFPEAIVQGFSRLNQRRFEPDQAINWQEKLVEWVTGQGSKRLTDEPAKPSRWRLLSLWAAIVLAFVILEGRAIHLMLFQRRRFTLQAQENRILIRRVIAPRGLIFDRHKTPLSRNSPAFRIVQGEKTALVDRETALMLEATEAAEVVVDSVRMYPYNELFAHLVGYIAEISKEELTQDRFKDYQPRDRIGRAGIEQTYEDELRGVNGRELVEVNVRGEEIRKLAWEEHRPGNSLRLTVDLNLQKVAFDALKKGLQESHSSGGAVVVNDPTNGEILSLVSLPSFNPNLFIKGDVSELTGVLEDENYPLVNRAISGSYPPGSTIKPVIAVGALESGVITPETTIEDTGIISLGPYTFSNWYYTQYGKVEGPLDLVGAIRRSNDIYFYRLGEKLGPEKMATWFERFGVGRNLGIELPGEAAGMIGSDEWKRKNLGQPWFPGDSLHLAIGQGFIQATPLQINLMTATFANGGTLWQPGVVKALERPDGSVDEVGGKVLVKDFVSPETMEVVREGMHQACAPGGTGWPLFDFPVAVGCKTGTAEVGNQAGDVHAWFTTFAPFEDPEIVITVLLENGGEGSSNAAPVAQEILGWWFGPGR